MYIFVLQKKNKTETETEFFIYRNIDALTDLKIDYI